MSPVGTAQTDAILATNDNIAYILMCLQAADDIAVDTETTGLNVRNNVDYLMGVCVDVPGACAYLPFRHHDSNVSMRYLSDLVGILESKPLIWHNRKFDMHSFKTIGVDPLRFNGPQYDTLLIAHLVDEELPSKTLDYLAKRYLKESKYEKDRILEFGKAVGFDKIPASMMYEYGAQDARLTRRLRDTLWPLLVKQELERVYWDTEAPFTRLLYKMEQYGVGTDPDFCESKSHTGRTRMATISRELGGANPASPVDLKSLLLDKLEMPVLAHTAACEICKSRGQFIPDHEGKPSFNKRVMEDYDDLLAVSSNPTAKRVNEYRGWQKAVTSLYEPMLEKVGPDGRIRTEFKQHGTVTGRLSATNPNLQQVPRGSTKPWNGDAKSAFNSGVSDYALVGWDYSQIELRLAAAYGSESLLITEFSKDKADPFSVLAPLIFGTLTEETRHDTKTFVYANLYGAGLRKIALQLGRPMAEVEGLYANYKESIRGIMAVSQQVSKLVESRGYVKYWDGRRRHFRNKRESYKAWNSLCQGGAAQLVKQAMLRCEEFEDENCRMVLTVHDEITFVIRRDLIPVYEPLIVKAMTNWPQFGVNLAVAGKEWK